MNMKKVMEDTPLKKGTIYFDHAAGSICPGQVIGTMCQFIMRMNRVGPIEPRFYEECQEIVKEAKQAVAEFIGANTADEIAFTRNGSEALNMVINGIPWKAKDEVIVSSLEMTSGFVPLLRLVKEKGIKLKVAWNNDAGAVEIDEIERLITKKTRLISMIHLSNAIGTLQLAEEVGKICRAHDILYLLNASQSTGQIPIDVRKLGCDFLTSPCRKWLRGPEALGFFYCRYPLIEELVPSFIGWNSVIWLAEKEEYRYPATAERFEAGEHNYPALVALRRAVQYIREIGGIEEITDRVRKLTVYLIDALKKIKGVQVYGSLDVDRRGGIVSFNIEHMKPESVRSLLSKHSIISECGTFAAPLALKTFGINECVRACVHYFNDYSEIDKFINVLIKEL